MITLLVITDGRRECIARSIPSALANLEGPITRRLIFDDSGDEEYRAWLRTQFPTFSVMHHHDGRQGFAGAIRAAWDWIMRHELEPFVFHLEDDFTFNRQVRLREMMGVLKAHPYLVQLALRRQPWNDDERDSGGIIEQHPDAYQECFNDHDWHWLEHRQFFTTNPSLYRRELCESDWPTGPESEGRFTHHLLADPLMRFGFWGRRDSGEWVHHIGDTRVGSGY